MAEPRQSQDFVRGVKDEQAAPEPRPTPSPLYLGPINTTLLANAAAGATAISVASTAGMSPGDTVEILVGGLYAPDAETQFRTTIATVPTSTSLTLSLGLPAAASSGTQLSDLTAAVSVDPANFPASNGGGGPGGTGIG